MARSPRASRHPDVELIAGSRAGIQNTVVRRPRRPLTVYEAEMGKTPEATLDPRQSITGVITWSRTNIERKYGRARRAHFVAVPRNSSGIVSEISGPASGLEIRDLFAPSVSTPIFSGRPQLLTQ